MMKKISISLVTMGITCLGLAQNLYPEFHQFNFKNLGRLSSNYEYRNQVQKGITPNQVKYLEKIVSDWDATEFNQFEDRNGEEFKVTFRSNLGQITAYYDDQGNIISAEERFRNIALPKQVGIAIAKEYPKCKIVKNRNSLLYVRGNKPKKDFKVQIGKDNFEKWLKVDSAGRIS